MFAINCILLFTLFFSSIEGHGSGSWKTSLAANKGTGEINSCSTYVAALTWGYDLTVATTDTTYTGHNHGKRRNSGTSLEAVCSYPPALGSLLICAAELDNYNESKMKKFFKYAVTACADYVTDQDWTYYQEQYLNATDYFSSEDVGSTNKTLYSPHLPEMTQVKAAFDITRASYYDNDSGTWFSVGLCVYFLVLIIIGTIHNFLRQTGLAVKVNNSKISKYIQSYITLPSVFPHGSYSTPVGPKWFSSLLPNRLELLVETGIFILEVAFYSVSYRQHDGNNANATSQWRQGVGYRSGILAFGKIPLLVLFAGRNNFLTWLTGWSYMTFIQYHKVLARWMFLDSLIHSVLYTIDSLGYYTTLLKRLYFACGVAATVLAGVIVLFSFHVFRRHWYETFLITHIALAIGFIAMCWYHCKTLGWCEWLVAACCVWFFDRLVRITRMSLFGYRKAQITAVGDELFKVEVAKPSWWIHTPGHYGFIYFAGWIFWENHPFTLAVEGKNISLYIKVKKGITSRIWKKLMKNGGTMNWRVCVEGPYGGEGSTGAKRYDDLLMIAGGSGVPGVLDSAVTIGKGTFIWIVRELNDAKPYSSLVKRLGNVDVNIHVTREQGQDQEMSLQELFDNSSSEDLSTDTSSKESKVLSDKENVVGEKILTIKYGRPNIQEILSQYIGSSAGKSIGILACGPPQLMDDLRHYVSKETLNTTKSIDYFDEYQIW